MSKFVKGLLTKDFENKFSGVTEFVVVDTTGIDGVSNNLLRAKLGQQGIKLTVVRNSMMRQALNNMNMDSAADLFGKGPRTVVYGGDNAVDVAKAIDALLKEFKQIEFTGAYVDGESLGQDGAKALAKMKSRVELQGDVVMLAKSPGARLASAIASPGGIIAGCIKTIIDEQEKAA
ncbi:MAG: 50S ribosomal protein L10 [Anaerohalosphaeraceae bacterium]|nr:50S ribosomal protein L10 [Anaerohalosphaeraceae bacterium]